MTILYTYERDCGLKNYVVFRHNGRVYERPCVFDFQRHAVFRFLGKLWYTKERFSTFAEGWDHD